MHVFVTLCVCQGTECECTVSCQRPLFCAEDQMLLMVKSMLSNVTMIKNKTKQNLSTKQLWPLFFPLQMMVRMKNAKGNICVFFSPLSQIYRELLRYACVNLSILEIDSLVGCDVGLCFKLLNS